MVLIILYWFICAMISLGQDMNQEELNGKIYPLSVKIFFAVVFAWLSVPMSIGAMIHKQLNN